MRRSRPALVVAILAIAAVWVAPGSGGDPAHHFAGDWAITFSFGGTGTFTFDFVEDDADGLAQMNAIAANNGSSAIACDEPSDYYEGTWTSPTDSGTLAGCTTGDDRTIHAPYTNSGGVGFGVYLVATLGSGDTTFSGSLYDDIDGDGLYTAPSTFDGTRICPPPARGLAGGACGGPPEEPPPGGGSPPPAEDKTKCQGKEATITPNPDAPAGFAIAGTAADDVIVGTDGADRILGLGGNDIICGFGGDDTLIGAEGDDDLYGGLGNDREDGGIGKDRLYGDFSFVAGFETVVQRGGGGIDKLDGGADDDSLDGGSGSDQITGGAGADRFEGDPGNDRIDGGEQDDQRGGRFTGQLFGDYVNYGLARRAVTIDLSRHKATGGAGRDVLRGIESIYGSNHNDVIRGSSAADLLYGGVLGNDSIYGLGGNDKLLGGAGSDLLVGGPNIDLAIGGSGLDVCAAENRTGCERVRVGGG